ncbi:MAG: hypothetical protein LBP59_08670 [Planctomycetaceae bacterium]|jgi:hypothetical protein|nr:hypothetical protein [Planctomycetaceae bacterium]
MKKQIENSCRSYVKLPQHKNIKIRILIKLIANIAQILSVKNLKNKLNNTTIKKSLNQKLFCITLFVLLIMLKWEGGGGMG